MNILKTYIWEYRFILVAIILIGMYAIISWKEFKSKAYALMLQAKSLAKDAVLKSGDEQAEWVVKRAYQFLPPGITVFISEALMEKIICKLYQQAKDYLDDGKLNNSIN